MDYNKIIIECSSEQSPWKLMRYRALSVILCKPFLFVRS